MIQKYIINSVNTDNLFTTEIAKRSVFSAFRSIKNGTNIIHDSLHEMIHGACSFFVDKCVNSSCHDSKTDVDDIIIDSAISLGTDIAIYSLTGGCNVWSIANASQRTIERVTCGIGTNKK
jgi:hypothetical protein